MTDDTYSFINWIDLKQWINIYPVDLYWILSLDFTGFMNIKKSTLDSYLESNGF